VFSGNESSEQKKMIKRILSAIGIGSAPVTPAADEEPVGPYKDHTTNLIYQLLFCDQLKLFKANHEERLTDPWATLFRKDPEVRLPAGLDTLAVFEDGGARYINPTGKIAEWGVIRSPVPHNAARKNYESRVSNTKRPTENLTNNDS